MRSATRRIRSASATEDPPYFCTTSATIALSRSAPACLQVDKQDTWTDRMTCTHGVVAVDIRWWPVNARFSGAKRGGSDG
jgi:hypothetical protein